MSGFARLYMPFVLLPIAAIAAFVVGFLRSPKTVGWREEWTAFVSEPLVWVAIATLASWYQVLRVIVDNPHG